MRKRQITILSFLLVFSAPDLLAQEQLRENVVSDSLVRKLKIRQVREDWFTDTSQASPANTTIVTYLETGRKSQRIHINYAYHKFVSDFTYDDRKNTIIETQRYFNWNHRETKRKGDTIIKKTIRKYDLNTKRATKAGKNDLDDFQPQVITDALGRVSERRDTIKGGYATTQYTYDSDGKMVQTKRYTSLQSEPPTLSAIDSFHYNREGQLLKETWYQSIRENENKWTYERALITTYTYRPDGLVLEKTDRTMYRSLGDREPSTTIYRYRYEFY